MNLSRLKGCGREIDQVLKQSKEFNTRIEDPTEWMRYLKKKQTVELSLFKKDRDVRKAELII